MRKPLPASCGPSLHLLPFLILLLLLSLTPVSATTVDGEFNVTESDMDDDKQVIMFLPRVSSVFGFGPTGLFTYDFKITKLSLDETISSSCTLRISLCEVSDIIVRDASFQRRQVPFGVSDIDETLATRTCDENSRESKDVGECERRILFQLDRNPQTSPSGQIRLAALPNPEMYIFSFARCGQCGNPGNDSVFSVTYDIAMRNPDTRNEELGFEEAAFPTISAIVAGFLAVATLILVFSVAFVALRRPPVRRVLLLVLAACFLKALGAAVTFLYFWSVARNGTRGPWYTATRLLIAGVADIAYVTSVMSFATGYSIIPDNWFGEGRSPLFLVYIGVTLQVLITIAVKLMFPYRYLGMVTYVAAAGTIAIIAGIMSHRNYRFTQRYAILIERSHVIAKTTPILRMQRFYLVNLVLVSVLYLSKIIGLAIYDYNNERPDLLWASFELADTVLLLWLTFCVLPRKKSAVYLDLSNVSDTRLHQADAWRASIAAAAQNADRPAGSRRSSNGSEVMSTAVRVGSRETAEEAHAENAAEDGVIVTLDVEGGRARPATGAHPNPQPPWISWEPGMSLPRPDTATWGGRIEVRRILRREKKFVPVLPSSIVLGIPAESPDTVKLAVGNPTIGPGSVPRTFDEKGQEIIRPHSDEPEDSESTRPAPAPPPPAPPVTTPAVQNIETPREQSTGRNRLRFLRFRRGGREETPNNNAGPSAPENTEQGGGADGSSLLPQGFSPSRAISNNDSGHLDLLSVASSTMSGDGRVYPFHEEIE